MKIEIHACDRCGNESIAQNLLSKTSISAEITPGTKKKITFELCDDCKKEVKTFEAALKKFFGSFKLFKTQKIKVPRKESSKIEK